MKLSKNIWETIEEAERRHAAKVELCAREAWYRLLWQFNWPRHCKYLSAYMAQD